MLLISGKVDGEYKTHLIAQCKRNIVKLRRHFRSDYSRGPEGVISIIPVQCGGTVVTGAVHRTRFVLLSLFRFLLLSVSQLVKTAAALGARLMTPASRDKGFICEAAGVRCGQTRRNRSFVPSLLLRPIPSVRACTLLPRRRTTISYSPSRFFLERCICFRETMTLFRRTATYAYSI